MGWRGRGCWGRNDLARASRGWRDVGVSQRQHVADRAQQAEGGRVFGQEGGGFGFVEEAFELAAPDAAVMLERVEQPAFLVWEDDRGRAGMAGAAWAALARRFAGGAVFGDAFEAPAGALEAPEEGVDQAGIAGLEEEVADEDAEGAQNHPQAADEAGGGWCWGDERGLEGGGVKHVEFI